MARIEKRPQADEDLFDIWAYLSDYDRRRADVFVDEIDAAFQRLAAHPLIGRDRPELASDLRSFRFKTHIIYYRPLSDGIEVVRILHGARDISSDLF